VGEVKIKGTALSSAQRYTLERFGEDGWGMVLDGLTPEDRQQVERGVLVRRRSTA
jgi:hypothetical protein